MKAEYVGTWWNGTEKLYRIDGKVYAINEDGWNGEEYRNCWQVVNDTEADGNYTLTPVYAEDEDGELVGFDVEEC